MNESVERSVTIYVNTGAKADLIGGTGAGPRFRVR